VLNYLFPVMTVLFSGALVPGERLTLRRLASVLVAFFGAYWVLTRGQVVSFRFTNWAGALAALGAAVCYGFFSAACKRMRYELFTGQLIFFGTSAVFAWALAAVSPRLGLPLRMPEADAWLGVFVVGIASNCLGTIFWFRAIRHGDTALMSSLVYLTLFVSLGFFYVLRAEEVRPSALVGSAFVVLGAVLASRPAKTSAGNRNPRY
jgi:drug/metabolite transporter (DMT)-like permease